MVGLFDGACLTIDTYDYKAPQLKNKDGVSIANGIFAEILKSKE